MKINTVFDQKNSKKALNVFSSTFVDAVAPMYDNAAETFGQDVMDAVAEYR